MIAVFSASWRSELELTVALRMAFRALGRNKMRTALTMLGVIIGVAAVICTVAIGEGASQRIQTAIADMGANMVWIEAGGVNLNGVRTGNGTTKTLTLEDAKAIEDQIPLVSHVTPNVDTPRAGRFWKSKLVHANAGGYRPNYLYVRKVAVDRGTFFGQDEIDRAENVCVLGRTVSNILFVNDEDPIGQTIRVANQPCKVIGLLQAKGQSRDRARSRRHHSDALHDGAKENQGHQHGWMISGVRPISHGCWFRRRNAKSRNYFASGTIFSADRADDFNIRHPIEIANAMADSARMMEILLASIASIALVVGGIGIMNIMLVSVTERTREIGVRMAVGASEKAVQMQFLSEAVVMSLMGGAIGLVMGLIGSAIIAYFLQWPTAVPLYGDIARLLYFPRASASFFGYYPARKAAQPRSDRSAPLRIVALDNRSREGRRCVICRASRCYIGSPCPKQRKTDSRNSARGHVAVQLPHRRRPAHARRYRDRSWR